MKIVFHNFKRNAYHCTAPGWHVGRHALGGKVWEFRSPWWAITVGI